MVFVDFVVFVGCGCLVFMDCGICGICGLMYLMHFWVEVFVWICVICGLWLCGTRGPWYLWYPWYLWIEVFVVFAAFVD